MIYRQPLQAILSEGRVRACKDSCLPAMGIFEHADCIAEEVRVLTEKGTHLPWGNDFSLFAAALAAGLVSCLQPHMMW